MTEPEVAGSDPTDIRTTARRAGDGWVINGHKWFVSGAIGASVCLTLVRTDDGPDRSRRLSIVLVPMNAAGVKIIRRIPVFGRAAGAGHCEVRFDNCRVGADALLGGVGMGFKIAQDRLGPGRIHHCMRAIGMAERARTGVPTCGEPAARRRRAGLFWTDSARPWTSWHQTDRRSHWH
jgi:acyl-CoA dehydrogenase